MIFCIESSGRETLIAVSRHGRIYDAMLPDRDGLQSRFLSLLSDINASPAEIAAIAIGSGPGSFTGLRVGFAFAHGLARGLDIPLWPVPSFELLAQNLLPNHDTVAVLVQARKERWFAEGFGRNSQERAILDAKELAQWLPVDSVICGPGCESLPDELKAILKTRIAAEPSAHKPRAKLLIELAESRWQGRERLNISDVLPDYGLEFGAA